LLNAIVEGVLQIVWLLHTPRLPVEDVGARVDMPAVVGVPLMMRWLIGRVYKMIVPRLILVLHLPQRRTILEIDSRCGSGGSDYGLIAGGGRPAAR
jgi:hypothetical protein